MVFIVTVALKVIMGMKGFMSRVNEAQECVRTASKSKNIDNINFWQYIVHLNHWLYFLYTENENKFPLIPKLISLWKKWVIMME